MELGELMYAVGSLAVTLAVWLGIYWLIRRSTAAGVREGARTEDLQRQLDEARREVETLGRRVDDLERARQHER